MRQHLSKAQIKELRTVLEAKQEECHGRFKKSLSDVRGTHPLGDIAERSDIVQSHELAVALANQNGGACRDIEEALARIEAGTYGFCLECGNSIPYIRIKAVPATRRCVPCTEQGEEVPVVAKATTHRRRPPLGARL